MPIRATGNGSAPGKVILLGEHAVVYGRTALAAAIDRRVTVTVVPSSGPARITALSGTAVGTVPVLPLAVQEAQAGGTPKLAVALGRALEVVGVEMAGVELSIGADLPVGVGLGSSAALSVALIRALADATGQSIDEPGICARAFEIEKIFHGYPSGIDNTVATYGGAIAFRRDAEVRPLQLQRPARLVIALGGAPRETQRTVTALRRKWEAELTRYEALFDEVGALVTAAEAALFSGDFSTLGRLMNHNQELLARLGVSTEELDQMITLARANGALGAKLTGGGGGGAIICLCPDGQDHVAEALTRAGWRAFATTIGYRPEGTHGAHADDLQQRAGARA